jgi:ABC-2 type transport system permease protein
VITLELLKLWRSRRIWIAVFALTLFLALMLFGFYTYAVNETRGNVEFRYTFENESYFNGLTFALYSFYFGFVLLLPVFAATEGGAHIAGETHSRTVQILLSRPFSRSRIFLSKFGIALAYLGALVGGFLLSALLVGLVAVGWGDLHLYPGVLQMTDRPQCLVREVALARFALVWPFATLSLTVPLAMSFLFSSYCRSAVHAVGLAVSTYLVLYVVSEIHFFELLRPWLFTAHSAAWRMLFQESVEWGVLWRDTCKLLVFSCGFLGIAVHRFRTREET